jgi:alpha-beta hydrolase superfamily lysophospholipase
MDNKAVERFADLVLKKNKDVAVIIYNAPCHGDDVKKKLSLADCDKYITLVTEYTKTRFKTDRLYVYANSFGGYQILKYISEHGMPYRKLALRCPAVNMYTVADSLLSAEERRLLEKSKPVPVGFDRKVAITKDWMNELKESDICVRDYSAFAKDIIILQGTKDEIVSCGFVEEFAEKNGIEFIPVENADHRFIDPVKMDSVIKTISKFFDFNN